MQRLQEQKQKIKKELQSIEEHKEPLNKKELQEMKELLIVNMALLEVLEESHPDAIKKKNSGSKESSSRKDQPPQSMRYLASKPKFGLQVVKAYNEGGVTWKQEQ